MSLFNSLPGAVAQGLVWGIMAIGVYLTFRILDFADLTVDGSLCTGGAVCIVMMLAGQNVWVALLCGRDGSRILHRYPSYLYGNPGYSFRYPDPAGPVFH